MMKKTNETSEASEKTSEILKGTSGSSVNIAVDLRSSIMAGPYAFGEKLPPERELSVVYNA